MQNGTSAATDKNLSQVIKIDEARIQQHLGEMVRSTVEQTLNAMLDAEADQLCHARRYEHTEARTDQRAGHYPRKLHTKAGEVELQIPKLRQAPFETAIIERYRRRGRGTVIYYKWILYAFYLSRASETQAGADFSRCEIVGQSIGGSLRNLRSHPRFRFPLGVFVSGCEYLFRLAVAEPALRGVEWAGLGSFRIFRVARG
jgi:hypothetical protein